MSKIKLSFSLIIALLLVGILSTAAFAKDPYGLKPAQVQGTTDLLVNYTSNSAASETDATKYDLHIYDPSGNQVAGSPYANLGVTSGKGSVTVSGLVPGDVYKIQLTYAGQAGVLSTTTGVVTESNNSLMYQVPDSHVDVDGSGLLNANQTGYNNTRKQRSGQKVHGFYTNNTNSCASCHQTHTAADGEYLLFKDGTYSTCSACHDGTTGAKNSFAPATKETTSEVSGTFNVQADHNSSIHHADGSLQLSAAPGGNSDASTNAVATATWGSEFNCASCHAAHGSGTSAENNLNLDPMGWAQVAYSTANNDTKNGKLFQNILINTTVPTTFSTPYVLVKKTIAVSDISTDKTKYGYLYTRAGVAVGDKLIQTYRWDGNKYVADYSLWLRDKGHVGAPFTNADTQLKGADGKEVATNLTYVWKDGFAFGTGADLVASAQIAIGVDVESTNDMASLYDSANANYVVDSGLQMSKYCASCHTDYLSTTRTNVTGNYTTAHRHKTAADNLTCIRCHYGHGSDAQIMKDASDNTYWDLGANQTALDYLKDPNPSSALKRYTGMSVCYACHGQGEQFLGNPNNKERPANGQPGTPRTPLAVQ